MSENLNSAFEQPHPVKKVRITTMLPVAVNPPKCDHGVQGNHGVHADCSLGDAGQVFGSTVLLSNLVKNVSFHHETLFLRSFNPFQVEFGRGRTLEDKNLQE